VRRLAFVLAAIVAVLIPGTPALAHNALITSAPADGATLATAPREVQLRFVERLNPEFTTIAVSDAALQRVPTGTPVLSGDTGTVPITGHLADGTYTVAYRTVSVDGHVVQGKVTFTVADPAGQRAGQRAGQKAADPAGTKETATKAAPPETTTNKAWIIAGAAAVLVLTAALLVSRRRRPASRF
jgi:copper resistance protein C